MDGAGGYRGGRGAGGGGYGNRRGGGWNGGGGGGGGGFRSKRRGYSNHHHHNSQEHQQQQGDPREEWRRQLQSTFSLVGDFSKRTESSRPLHENVKAMVSMLATQSLLSRSRGDDGRERDILNMVIKAAGSLGMQAPVYALLTAIASSQPDAATFSGDVVHGVMGAMREALAAGSLLRVKLYLRFLGELCNCGVVNASDLGDFMASLVDMHLSATDDEVGPPCKDLIVYTVMASLPWCGQSLNKFGWATGLEKLVETFRGYMSNRVKNPPLRRCSPRSLLVLADEEEEDESGASLLPDSLEVLWEVVLELHNSSWSEETEVQAIPRPWRECSDDLSQIRSVPLTGTPDMVGSAAKALGSVALAAGIHSPKAREQFAVSLSHSYAIGITCELELFDEDSGGGAATVGSLPLKEKVVLREYIRDLLLGLQPLVKDDGTRVGTFSIVAEQLLSISKLAPEGCETQYLVVEFMLQAITVLPQPPHFATYLNRVMLELCRVAPDAVPQALSVGTGIFFHELKSMDTSALKQFSSWFAHHLKDTNFAWPFWNHWFSLINEAPLHPQRMFLSFTLQCLFRLTTIDKLKAALPQELWPLALPLEEGGGEDDGDEASYGPKVLPELMPRTQGADDMDEGSLAERMKGGQDPETLVQSMVGAEGAVGPAEALHAALHAAETSPAALDDYIEKYASIMRGSDASREVNLIGIVRRVWHGDPGIFVSGIESLLRHSVVTPMAVLDCLSSLEKEQPDSRVSSWLADPVSWELLEIAVRIASQSRNESTKAIQDLAARSREFIPVDPFEEEEVRGKLASAEKQLRQLLSTLVQKAVALVGDDSGPSSLVPQSLLRWAMRCALLHSPEYCDELFREAADTAGAGCKEVLEVAM